MSIDSEFVLAALLQHNYFPLQTEQKEELPPILRSLSFDKSTARQLQSSPRRSVKKTGGFQGYDAVEYRLTRFNGIPRTLSIPHPKAYAELALCIHEHWDHLNFISRNSRSLIKPRKHRDGRLIIMNYENRTRKSSRRLAATLGKKVILQTDISNFFPSIYSHSIPWALVGLMKSKKTIQANAWYNDLDAAVRLTKRNETQGVPVGPATSNIISELILARVDEELECDFTYERFNDDYTVYCESEQEAQAFTISLVRELAQYKLTPNINKTKTLKLPRALAGDDWVVQLSIALPRSDSPVMASHAINYLDLAISLARATPDGSVLKYALRALVKSNLESGARRAVIEYALNLSFYQPVLLPLIDELLRADGATWGSFRYDRELRILLREHSRLARSDAVSWLLYYFNRFSLRVPDEIASEIVDRSDCIPMLMLYLSGDISHQARVISFARKIDKDNLYELDRYWLLLYELFFENRIPNPYAYESTFEVLKVDGVSFVLRTV